MVKLFFGFMTLAWLPYGVMCFLSPVILADYAGVNFSNATGQVEMQAMYGGLQMAIGVASLVALLNPSLQGSFLLMHAILNGGLGLSRLLAALLIGEWEVYTLGAMGYELVAASIALWLWRRHPTAQAEVQ